MTQIIFRPLLPVAAFTLFTDCHCLFSVGCPRAGKTERMSAMFLLKQQT